MVMGISTNQLAFLPVHITATSTRVPHDAWPDTVPHSVPLCLETSWCRALVARPKTGTQRTPDKLQACCPRLDGRTTLQVSL